MIGPREKLQQHPHERRFTCAQCGTGILVCGYVDDLEPPYVCVFDCRLGSAPAARADASTKRPSGPRRRAAVTATEAGVTPGEPLRVAPRADGWEGAK